MQHAQRFGLLSLAAIAGGSALGESTTTDNRIVEIDEIVVTATKREQTLQDVPISVSVTTEETLQRGQIRDLVDLQSVVPSLKVDQLNATGQTNVIIRGFGNGAGNDGIEGSVGVFVDGVYRSRTASALEDFPEVERIEVLRGPQSTLFGKNVSAGAISIVTARPQRTFGALTEIGSGNYGLFYGKSSITGPVSDTLALSLAGSLTQRDGYANNAATGNDVNDRDRWSVRGDVLWEPTSSVTVRVIGDYNRINETCCGAVSLFNGPATQLIGSSLGPIGDPSTRLSREVVANTDPTNRLGGQGLSAQIDWSATRAQVTSITAYRNQTNRSIQDVDFTGADLANKDERSEITSFSQEFRLASYEDGRLDWLFGAYYQDETIDTGRDTLYGPDIRPYADRLSGQTPASLLNALPAMTRAALSGQSNIYALELLQSLTNPAVIPGATYFQPGQGIHDFYQLDQVSYSFFGQVDYAITDRLSIAGGMAYLSDRKRASSDVSLLDRFAALNLQNVPEFAALGLPAGLYSPLNPLQFFYADTPNHAPVNFPNANESNVLDGSRVTYSARVAYDFGAVNTYVSYSTGWKAGAYNLSSDSRPPDVNGVGRTADPEDVTVYEVGLKTEFGSGYLNLAIFDQSIHGFQSNAYTGTGYNLVNAGKQSVRGIELDADFRPTNWLALTAAVTYLDPVYDSFKRAPCVSFDTARCPVDPLSGRMPDFRDLSGDKPARTAEWNATVSATLSHAFGNGYGTYLRTAYDYMSETQLTETVPANLSTWGQRNVNAAIGLTNERRQFEVMFWVRNLTDSSTVTAAFPTVAQAGSYSGFVNQPRTYGLAIRKGF